MTDLDKINRKIMNYEQDDIYVVFYIPTCGYCQETFKLLNNYKLAYKGYNINNIRGGFQRVYDNLSKQKDITGFDLTHKTKPIIFYKGKFVGGFTELRKKILSR